MFGALAQCLLLLRYQLLFAALLVSLPFIALTTGLQAALGNLFSLDDWYEAAVVSGLAVFMGWALMITTELRARLAASAAPPETHLPHWGIAIASVLHAHRRWGCVLLAVPLAVGMCLESWSRALVVAVGVLVGSASALLALGVVNAFYYLLVDPRSPGSGLAFEIPYANALKRIRLPHHRYTRPIVESLGPWVQQGHLFCLVFAIVSFVIYVIVGNRFRPYGPHSDEFPALGYLLLLLTVGAWVLPAIAHWLDGWRIPAVLALLLFSLLGYELFQTDHYYEVRDAAAQPCSVDSAAPASVIEQWFSHHADHGNPKLVAVAASGGGITAAAWTADVLTAIDAQEGERFTRSLTLISATSGGSVGSMYYLDRFQRSAPEAAVGAAVREAATASSLREVAWGFVYPDLQRFFFPPLVAYESDWADRAWAMEYAWRRRLESKDRMLSDWRCPVAAGDLPVPVFNATVVDTGDLLLLTPVDLRGVERFRAFKDFYQLYPGKDLTVQTAVRLSATFPYVTPVARPTDPGSGRDYHVADGGYDDNFGVDALIAWLDVVLPRYRALGGRDLLVIEIRAFPPSSDAKSIKQPHGWWFEILGPVMTMLNVRTWSQLARNDDELTFLKSKWESQNGRFFGAVFTLIPPESCYQPPLSWQLSPFEKTCISRALTEPQNAAAMTKIATFFAAPAEREEAALAHE